MVNLHALAGGEAMARAAARRAEGAAAAGVAVPKLLAVTVLTSHDGRTLEELGIRGTPAESVARYAALAAEAGMDGVVASPEEASALRAAWPKGSSSPPGCARPEPPWTISSAWPRRGGDRGGGRLPRGRAAHPRRRGPGRGRRRHRQGGG